MSSAYAELGFAVSLFTAAVYAPHDANSPLRGGCILTISFRFFNRRGAVSDRKAPAYTGHIRFAASDILYDGEEKHPIK